MFNYNLNQENINTAIITGKYTVNAYFSIVHCSQSQNALYFAFWYPGNSNRLVEIKNTLNPTTGIIVTAEITTDDSYILTIKTNYKGRGYIIFPSNAIYLSNYSPKVTYSNT